jgi:stage II sporulation SpoD-like protein
VPVRFRRHRRSLKRGVPHACPEQSRRVSPVLRDVGICVSGRPQLNGLISAALIALVAVVVLLHPCYLASLQGLPASDRSPSVLSPFVRIGVLGLFHPHQLVVSAPSGQALFLRVSEESVVLEKSSGVASAIIRLSGDHVCVTAGTRSVQGSAVTVAGRGTEFTDFVLKIPGKIARRYHGQLEIRASGGILVASVIMDLETAVASVVAAEDAPNTSLEALKAQAVAARSYFVASHGRHHEFDFCDTTHCQFLREPPALESAAARAVSATRDLVLIYRSQPFAAMYTRSCSGRTHTPAELGLPTAGYPYYAVECKYCRARPARWTSRISAWDASALHRSDESARLNIDRHLGWSAVQSNDFIMKKDNGQIVLEGTGQGHGIGLCQAGARAMAADGADFREILRHYYPNATIGKP